MAAKSFKKGSGKDEMAKRILESALSTLIAIDTNHNYVLEGSTASDPILTEAGTKLVSSMQGSVKETAGTIGDAIAGVKKSDVKNSDSILIYDESSQANYRVSFETIAALIVAGAIENGDVLTSTKLWSLMANDSDYQINIAHLRDALADYLTKDKLQGLFRNEGGDAFVSKIFDDEALGVITFLSGLRSNGVAYMMKGLQIGLYQSGITGFGAKIDENGNGEFESLIVRRFLDVPELRYNRVDVLVGDKWRAPGGGIIECVTPDIDPNTGNMLMTGTASLKLEEGEIGCIAVDDICMGIFHDFNNPENNDDATTDDGFGNRTFAGFCTVYFRITEVTATTNIDGVNYYNKVFRYALRPVGGRWSSQIHPQNFMNFVVYGNFTNTSRQSATYETTSYTRMLRAQNTWEFSWANIGMQFGDCSLLANFDTQEEPNERANEASRYLFYIDGDIFHTGVLRRVDSHGRDIIDYYDQGVWDPTVEYFYKDRVYYNGSMWLLVREDTVDSQGVHHGVIGSEPSEDNSDWLAVVYSQSVRSMGHWKATKCPYPVSAIVNLAGILYISNKETTNPPRGLLTGKVNGQTTYLKDKDGKYFLIDENEDNISEDWDVLLDIREMVSGEDAIYINLTNDADSIITDINGNIAPGTEYPTTKGQLYRGSVQITSGITWGVSAVGCSATIAPESGVVVTSNMTDDKATVTISATYNNITYQKVFTFSKLFGADKYILQPSAEVIQFNPNAQGGTGEYTPSVLTMRAYVIKGGEKMEITSGSGLGFIRFGGNNYYSGMTVTINNMSVFTSGKLTFELFDNQATPQLQDMEEIPLVQDGVNGAGSAVINLTNDTDTVCCDSDGNIDPSDSLPITNAQLYYDLDKVTTGLEWHCNCEGCTATIEEDQNNPGEGKVTVTGMSADFAKITIFCNFRGEQYSKIFTFKKLFGADKYYLQVSSDSVVMDKTGSFQPNSITARAYCKRFGNDPVECTAQDFPHIKIACQALQQQSGYSPQSVVITNSVFTDRHLVFTLIDDSTPGDVKVLDTEDIPLVLDGTDGIDGHDGKDWHYAGMWDSEAEYKAGDVVRMGDSMYVALVNNTNKPPREILKDGVDGKYLKDENDRYLMTGSNLTDDINWNFYFRDGRDGINGVDGKDGRDGQDGDTPVFVNLTNDTDSVICDMEGNPLEELPTTVAQFFFGSVQLLHEDGLEWSISHLVGCTLEGENGITDDGYVQVKTMSADRAQVTIRATYKSQYYEKNFNFTKLYGTDKYVLTPNFGTVQFNPDNGTYYPISLVLNAFVVKNGTTINLTQASGLGYIQIGNDTQHKYYNGDSIQTATFFAVSGIEITLRDPDGVVKDKEYIPRISDGRKGDDGDDAVTMWFDDSNIHFICDAEGTPASGQTYSTTGKLYKGGNDVALHASLSKAESTTVNCTGVLNVADNTEFILTVTGFKDGATDSNEVKVTLVAADESISREFTIHVDKVRPGADGKSPVIYNIVPNTNVVNKDKETGVFTPAALTPSVRKSYVDANGAVAHQMLSASQALSSDGIHIYYRFDAMIQTVLEAIGNLDDGNPLTLPSSMNSYVNFAIAKSDGIILDNQSVSAISDGIDGVDGNGIVSITRTFAISNVSSTPNESTEPQHFGNWTAQSPAVTETYPHLWAKEVVVFTKTNSTTKYYHIGSRGDNGIDAQDMEFVYIRTKTSTAPVILADDTYTDSKGKTYTDDGHLPHVSGNSNIESDNSGVSGKTYECTDDPKGVDSTWKFEWEIKREKGAADTNGHREWQAYSGTMILRNRYVRDIAFANVWYALADSGTTEPEDSSFTLDAFPTTLNAGKYVWETTKVTYSDGTSEFTAKMCLGPTTDFLSGTEVYAISTSNSTAPAESTANWKTTYEKIKGYYLWTATRVQYTNGNYAYLNKKCVGYWGEDGNGIQSVARTYARSKDSTSTNDTTAPGNIDTSIGTDGWASSSPSVTETYPYIWAKEVVTYTKSEATTKYYCIGARGANGVDAQDVEWAYIRTKTNVAPVISGDGGSSPYTDHNGKTYTSDDHLPKVVAGSGGSLDDIEDGNSGSSSKKYECTDDPKGVNDVWKYEWEIKRSKGTANSNGKRTWNPYNGTMTLHNNFAESLLTIDITNDSDQFGTDSESIVLVQQVRSTVVSMMYGTQAQAFLAVPSVALKYDDGTNVPTGVATVSVSPNTAGQTEYIISVTIKTTPSGTAPLALHSGIYADITGSCSNGGPMTVRFSLEKVMSGAPGVTPVIYQLNPTLKSIQFSRDSSNNLTPSSRRVTVNMLKTIGNTTQEITSAVSSITFDWGFDDNAATSGHTGCSIGSYFDVSNSDASSYSQVWIKLSTGDKEIIPIVRDGVNGAKGQNTVHVDLDNENDSMLYNGSGELISGNCVTHAKLFDGQVQVQSGITWRIKTKTNVTATISGDTVTVTAISANSGSVIIAVTYNDVEYTAILSIKKLVGVDKYEIVTTPDSVSYNGNTDTYSSQSIKVDVYRTKQNGTREKLSTLPSGITLKYTGATGEKSINPGATIPYTDYGTANILVVLRDSDLNVLDSENIPIILDGINGQAGQSFVSRGHWRSGEEYHVGDMVTFAGSIFRCLDSCTNIPPLQCLTDNGNYFLVDENGNYIVNYPLVRDTRHWELSIEYQRRIMFDLDNESDTILYDTNGKKVSQNVVSHAILYVDGAEYVGAATYGINASGCTATISGRTIIVTGVSGTGGTVEVTCTYDGNNYTAILSVRKLVSVNKYEIVPSANSVKKDPNNNNQYTPSAGVTFQIFKTDQTGTRRALTASDMNTGDEEGFRIGLIRGGQPEATIAINYTITPSDFEIGDCRITLYDKNNSVQDSEYIPVIAEGVNGKNTIRVDLDNENDSMLYDGSGNLISGNCIANATLYDGEAPVTSALTWKVIVRSGSVTTNAFNGTLPGNQLIVSGITSDAATILVYTRYKEYDRGITLTLKRLVGVDKYELSVSPNSVGKDGDTSAYDTDYIAVDVYKTAQNSSRTKLNSLPTGYTLKSIINGVTESISLGSQSIAKAKFAGTNIAIELRDNNNSLLDNENVPIIASGATGKNSVVANALPSSQIINQDITNVTNIDSPNLSETVIMEVWDGNRKLATNEITSIIVSQTNPHIYINDATGTPRITGSITLPTDRFVIKGVGKDGNNQYYSDASISCVVNFTLNGTQKSITVPVKVYVNLLGSWKVIVENGAEQKVGERINYEAGPDGTVLRTAWNANITESATALRSEYTEQIGKASEYGANLFGFSKGVVFSGNIIPFIQGYGFAQSSAGQIYIHDLGFGGKGGYFTISFYARMSSTNRTVTFNFWARGMLSVYNPDAATSDPISFSRGISASSWTRVTQTVYIKSFSNDTQRGGQFYVDDAPGDNLLYIRQLKIERGNEVTAFTPAAEDLAIVGNGQLITTLTNDGMSLDGEVDGRRADYFVYANPAGYVNDDVDYLSQVSEFNITQGKMYTLSFWAKCSSNGMIITSYLRSSRSSIIDNSHVIYDSGTNGSQMELLHSDGMSKVRLSTVWKQYFIHLYATNSVKTLELVPLSVLKEDNTYVTGTIYISDIRFVEGFDTDEGQYKSLIEQTARRISLSVEHDLSQTGIDILHQKIVLRADQVVFASSTGTTGKIWIDATDGSLHAIDGHFSGEITASTGSIGGFIIDSDAIRSSNSMVGLYSGATHTSQNNNSPVRFWAGSTSRDSAPFRVTQAGAMFAISGKIGGFTISSDSIGSQSNTENLYLSPSFAQIGNNQSYVIMGADVAPGTAGGAFTMAMRIENTKSPQSSGSWTFDTANYGIYINVKNGTKNYGIFSTAPIRGSAVYSDKVKFIQFSGDGYTIDLSQCNIYYFYCTSESRIYLPTKASIAKQFGYSTLPEDFGVVFTVIAKWDSAAFHLMGVENHNGYITNLGMAAGDVVRVLVTNINGVFVYKILSQYS